MLTRKQMEIEYVKANKAMQEAKNTMDEATTGLKAMECLLEIANKELEIANKELEIANKGKEDLQEQLDEMDELHKDLKAQAEELEKMLVALALHQVKQDQGDIEYNKVNNMEYFIPITKQELNACKGLGVVITTENETTFLTIGNKNYSLCDDCSVMWTYDDCINDIVEYNEFGRVAECCFF